MKTSRLFTFITTALLMTAGGCTDAEMDRINRNTSNPPAETVNARFQITDAITSTAFSTIGGGYAWYTSSYTEQLFGDGNNLLMYAEIRDAGVTAAATTFNNDWNTIYRNLQNLKQIMEKCADGGLNAGQPDLLGMAEVLWCIKWETLTLLHGDVPYSEALDSNNKTPKLDRQEDIYTDILQTIDSAITHLTLADNEQLNNTGSQDLLYQGEPARWLALAYGIRARLLLDGMYRYPDCLTAVEESAQKAFELGFDGAVLDIFDSPDQDNPWAAFMSSRNYLGANGTLATLLADTDDPRLEMYACDTFGTGTLWAPAGDASLAVTTQQVGAPAWLANTSAPVYILSKSELLLIQAEARARLGFDAATPMNEAIECSYDEYVRVSGTENATIPVLSIPDATLNEVMRQKFISTAVTGPISFYNDLRRARALGEEWLTLLNPNNTISGVNRWPLRLPYGNSDVAANPNIAAAFGSGNEAGMYIFTEPVWLFGGTR